MSGMKYIGGGAWIPGVPARDLTAEEASTHADAIAATEAAGHKLYEPVTPTAKLRAKKESEE